MGIPRPVLAMVVASVLLSVVALRNRVEPFVNLVSTYVLFPSNPVPLLDPSTLDTSSSPSSETVPRIIHQVKLGGFSFGMRPSWIEARQACMDLHPDYEFKLWDDESGNAFVLDQFGEQFYATYRGYPQEIMRSNVLRYLVLLKQGGVYLDLDLKCRVPLDAFLGESFVTPPAQPTGVNNAFIVAKPEHPFFEHLKNNLATYDLNWFGSPYVTNMMSTGCHFFSTMHLTYHNRTKDMKILPWDYRLNGHVTTPLFEHLGASSWHKGDAAYILSVGQAVERVKPYFLHFLFSLLFFSIALLVIAVVRRRRHHYRRLALQATGPAGGSKLFRSTSPISPSGSSSSSRRESFDKAWATRFIPSSYSDPEKDVAHMA